MNSTRASALSRMDLVNFEARLCNALSRFFSFKTHSLHFPLYEPDPAPVWLPDEDKLLLPLRPLPPSGRILPALGLFVAGGVEARATASMEELLPALPLASSLVLENLQLYKRGICDPLTGLYTKEHLVARLTQEIGRVKASLYPVGPVSSVSSMPYNQAGEWGGPSGEKPEGISPESLADFPPDLAETILEGAAESVAEGPAIAAQMHSRGGVAILVLHLAGLAELANRQGYAQADRLLQALAAELKANCPEQAVAARSGDYELALFLPGVPAAHCRKLAANLIANLKNVSVTHDLTRRKISIAPSLGYAIYPQDLDGISARSPQEQGRLLLGKARLAASLASEWPQFLRGGNAEPWPVLGFGRIVAEGGRVRGPLPLGRYLVNLGRRVNAREGQHFAVWNLRSDPPVYKGELLLAEVREDDSLAELISSSDPKTLPEADDQLLLLAQASPQSFSARKAEAPQLDPATGLLSHSDFMTALCLEREKYNEFSVVLMRLKLKLPNDELGGELANSPEDEIDGGPEDMLEDEAVAAVSPEHAMAGVVEQAGTSAQDGAGRQTATGGLLSMERFDAANGPGRPGADNAFAEHWLIDYTEWEDLVAQAALLCQAQFDGLGLNAEAVDEFADFEPLDPVGALGPLGENPALSRANSCSTVGGPSVSMPGSRVLGGRYGQNSLIFFLPTKDSEALNEVCTILSWQMQQLGLSLEAGIACHPFLRSFRKNDIVENARKALEYSALLPPPHIGVLDSLALNINADRLFSLGDKFGAIGEYQRAILADQDNTLAWNSLGVCLASLGRPQQAHRYFTEALRRNPDDLMALYNLGYLHQSAGGEQDAEEAEELYRRCLMQEPQHVYAMIRLGQLAEQGKDQKEAREWYLRAAQSNQEEVAESAEKRGTAAMIKRLLARLAIKEGKEQEARELLHEALLQDPQDASALQLLARLYLKAGEDPQVAASLARQSVSLNPGLKAGWVALANALQAMNKPEEADRALLRSEEL